MMFSNIKREILQTCPGKNVYQSFQQKKTEKMQEMISQQLKDECSAIIMANAAHLTLVFT